MVKRAFIGICMVLIASAAYAQNCTTQPSMNTMTITAAGTMAVTGDTTANTITIKLDQAWTSNTGWVTIFTNSGSYGTPGNNGSYRIISGNGSGTNGTVGATQLVLDGSALLPNPSRTNGGTTTAGGQSGRYVSDLGVIRNSARNYTFVWSTPGFNSDTWVSFGDDDMTGVGVVWRSGDTVTGTANHSITIDQFDPFYVNGVNNGIYHFTVWSDCFTNGVPDVSLSTHIPQGSTAPNQSGYAGGSMKILATTPDVTPGLNVFTMDGYNNFPTLNTFIPPQDGSHPGFRTAPGGIIDVPILFTNTTVPVANPTGDNAVNVTVDDWVPNTGGMGGLFYTLGHSGTVYQTSSAPVNWMGQTFISRVAGGTLAVNVPAGTPTSAPCGNMLGAEAMMMDGGTVPACAYPIKVTASRWWANYGCGTMNTCGPPGTMAQTPPVNVPFVGKMWLIIFNPAALVPTGSVGPWQNPYTSMPGIPCELNANIAVDKPNGVYPAGCFNYERGPGGLSGYKFSYQGSVPGANGLPPPPAGQYYAGQEANCAVNGQRSENSYVAYSQPIWFYDGGFVCHQLDVMFPPTGGTNNDEFEKHILGIYWDQTAFARVMDPVMFADYNITGAATVNSNAMCAAIFTGSSQYCDSITFPVSGDVSAIQNGLASGQRFRACINGTSINGVATSSYGCYVFPYQSPSQSASTAAGGTLAASSTIYVTRSYTDANNIIHSFNAAPVAVTTDTTCPTSGNCSVSVPCPPVVLNAAGYDVFARNGTTGSYYRQNTAGPLPLTAPCTAFTFGTAANPLQTSGVTATAWASRIVSIIAADNVAHTLTTNSNWGGDAPNPAYNPTVIVMRQLTGIPADTGTNANTLVCNSCTFTGGPVGNGNAGVPTSAVVYCGLTDTGDAGAPLYSLALNRGSTIQTIVDAHTINLTTAINCAAGANFEIRKRLGPIQPARIYGWANTPYDVWKRFGNYIGADTVMWLASNAPVTGALGTHCCDFSTNPSYRRETGLSMLSCHRAINVFNDLSMTGGTTALAPSTNCLSPTTAHIIPYPVFSQIENMTASNYGRGTAIGSFLDGVLGYGLIDWWQDPLMGVTNDPLFPYWTKRLTDALWGYYSARNNYASWCQPSWPHEWGYLMEDLIVGSCSQQNTSDCPNCHVLQPDGSQVPVNDYWSIMGNMLPLFAFFYQFTGNATIPQVGGMVPPPWKYCYPLSGVGVPGCGSITYGQAYQDMASWIFVHMASQPAWSGAGAKTLGEMGIWQDRAIGWMGGNGGGPPSNLSILTSSLPTATIGATYNASMSASGGTPPYTWAANVLPAGLTMSAAGAISGTPSAYGTTNITFTVTDSATPTVGTATINLPLTVTATVPVSAYPAYETGVIP